MDRREFLAGAAALMGSTAIPAVTLEKVKWVSNPYSDTPQYNLAYNEGGSGRWHYTLSDQDIPPWLDIYLDIAG